MGESDALAAVDAAAASWNHGHGAWALATPAHRIAKIQELVAELKKHREQARAQHRRARARVRRPRCVGLREANKYAYACVRCARAQTYVRLLDM
eukprot:6212498-Pleurochrysis_carterae.AAC.3